MLVGHQSADLYGMLFWGCFSFWVVFFLFGVVSLFGDVFLLVVVYLGIVAQIQFSLVKSRIHCTQRQEK